MDTLSIITLIAGIMMSLSYYPQAYKIFKMKKAEGISLVTYFMLIVGSIIWITYGIMKNDFVVVITFGTGTLGMILVTILKLVYAKKT